MKNSFVRKILSVSMMNDKFKSKKVTAEGRK